MKSELWDRIALLLLHMDHDLVTNDTTRLGWGRMKSAQACLVWDGHVTHPFTEQSSDTKGEERSSQSDRAKIVRRLGKPDGHDDGDAD